MNVDYDEKGVLNLAATNIKVETENSSCMDVCLKTRHGGGTDAVDMAGNVKGLVTLACHIAACARKKLQ